MMQVDYVLSLSILFAIISAVIVIKAYKVVIKMVVAHICKEVLTSLDKKEKQ